MALHRDSRHGSPSELFQPLLSLYPHCLIPPHYFDPHRRFEGDARDSRPIRPNSGEDATGLERNPELSLKSTTEVFEVLTASSHWENIFSVNASSSPSVNHRNDLPGVLSHY